MNEFSPLLREQWSSLRSQSKVWPKMVLNSSMTETFKNISNITFIFGNSSSALFFNLFMKSIEIPSNIKPQKLKECIGIAI